MFLEVDRVEGLLSTKKRNLESVSAKNTKLFSPTLTYSPTYTRWAHPDHPQDPAPRFMCLSFSPSMLPVFAKTPPVQPTYDPLSPRETDASVLFSQAEQTTTSGLYAVVSWRRRPARIPQAHASCAGGSFSCHNLRPPYLPARRSPTGRCPGPAAAPGET
jgi:hypothetical protein